MNTPMPLALPMTTLPTGQAVFLAVAGGIALVCALAVAFSNRAVHAAVYMMGMMIAIAGIYFSVGAEFLGAVQIVVYTGAIMMMFLFVIMLVGVQAVDSPRDSQTVTVVSALLLVLAFAVLAITAAVQTTVNAMGVKPPDPATNPVQIATNLINTYYLPMEMVACLLIIAAVGAMTLTHSDALLPRLTQRFIVGQRMKAYREKGLLLGQQVPPGVYAETNALDVPAINGETGRPEETSVPRVVRIRGEARSLGEASPWTARALAKAASGGVGIHGKEATRGVARSEAWGMPGSAMPELPSDLVESTRPKAIAGTSASEGDAAEKGENA